MKMLKCPVKSCRRNVANGEIMCTAHARRICNTALERRMKAARASCFAAETMSSSREAKMYLEIVNRDAIHLAGKLDQGELA